MTRPATSPDAIFYSTDLKLVNSKLKEYGLSFPDNMSFPQGGLFVVAVSDYVKESFQSASMDAAKHLLVLDLATDKAAAPSKAAADKKASRVIVVACPPIKAIQSFGVRTADGVVHTVKAEELKK